MPTPKLSNYGIDQLSVIFGPVVCDGFAEGVAVTIETNNPRFAKYVGGDGTVVRVKMADGSTRVTVRCHQGSAVNALFSAIHNADVLAPNGAGVLPLAVYDGSGTGVYETELAWIVGPPESVSYGADVEVREWIIDTADMKRLDGGST
jgi:hypothetical protein